MHGQFAGVASVEWELHLRSDLAVCALFVWPFYVPRAGTDEAGCSDLSVSCDQLESAPPYMAMMDVAENGEGKGVHSGEK